MSYKYIPSEYEIFGDLYSVLFDKEDLKKTSRTLSDLSLALKLKEYDNNKIELLLEMFVEITKIHTLLQMKEENGGKWVINDSPLTRDVIKGIKELDDITSDNI